MKNRAQRISNKRMATTTVTIQGNLLWLCARDKDAGLWVAQCPALRIMAEAETYAKLQQAIDECIQALFADLVQTNEFDGFLREHNWVLGSPMPPKTSRVRFDVPYEIQRRSAHDLAGACR